MAEKVMEVSNSILKEPLEVSIINIDRHFYATNQELGFCSDGCSSEEAIINFKRDLEDLKAC